jgi:pimeloyl-ACP methyl ester carboxylesterase
MNISRIKKYFEQPRTNIVCLHSSASSPAQWDELARLAGQHFNVIAPELSGYSDGASDEGENSLHDHVEYIHQATKQLRGPVHLVGHSFGGAVALRYAVEHEKRVASVSVYESAALRLLFGHDVPVQASEEINKMGHMVIYFAKHGNYQKAGKTFIDYASGSGSFDAMPATAKERVAKHMPAVAHEFRAVFRDRTAPAQYAQLNIPVQIIRGGLSPVPVRWVAGKLAELIPHASLLEMQGLDSMGPITHPEQVNPMIMSFIDQQVGSPSQLSKVA